MDSSTPINCVQFENKSIEILAGGKSQVLANWNARKLDAIANWRNRQLDANWSNYQTSGRLSNFQIKSVFAVWQESVGLCLLGVLL